MTPATIKLGVASHLRAWQALRKYNQVDCSQALGISPSFYNKLIYGVGSLTVELVCKISEVTGYTEAELMSPPEEPVELTRRWRTSDLVARLRNAEAIAVALGSQDS